MELQSFSSNFGSAMEDGEDRLTLFDVIYGRKTEKVVLQQLIMVARLQCDPTDRTELGAYYENINVHLTNQHTWDQGITGLLLIYPSCLLHIIEASEYMLDCFLNKLQATHQQPDCPWLEVKIVFMCHNLEARQFQQWSYMVLNEDQVSRNPRVQRLEEDEESIESLVCSVLTQLQELVKHLETPEVLPSSILDENLELLISPMILEQLLGRGELLSPQQYLQMYHCPLNISIDFGKRNSTNKYVQTLQDLQKSCEQYRTYREAMAEQHSGRSQDKN
ncbi:testis-expressed protein 47 [Anableps anableps]